MGYVRGKDGKIIGNIMEMYRNIWENYRKTMGSLWGKKPHSIGTIEMGC